MKNVITNRDKVFLLRQHSDNALVLLIQQYVRSYIQLLVEDSVKEFEVRKSKQFIFIELYLC